jgi:hypothetical protein
MPQARAAIVATAATGYVAAAATVPRLDMPLEEDGKEGEREREGRGVSMSMDSASWRSYSYQQQKESRLRYMCIYVNCLYTNCQTEMTLLEISSKLGISVCLCTQSIVSLACSQCSCTR